MRGLLVSAPNSGAGKTIIALGLLRAFQKRNINVYPAKSGPDYIDPKFHQVACGRSSINLDCWAMKPDLVTSLANNPSNVDATSSNELILIEGAMGVLDGGGKEGRGSAADLAEILSVPIILVIDASKQFHSVALAPMGLIKTRPKINLLGVILNNIGSSRHLSGARESLDRFGIELLGWLPKSLEFKIPERHLGLVLPEENPEMEEFIERISVKMDRLVEVDTILQGMMDITRPNDLDPKVGIDPLGQNMAIAQDKAFAFMYSHLIAYWQERGANILPFSPLADEGPDAEADAVFLPGGYPEIHLPQLAGKSKFISGMNKARERNALIYGECGGFMVLGDAIRDSKGKSHRMLGFLNHITSYQNTSLHLGYRHFEALPNPHFRGKFNGHEFHYTNLEVAGGNKGLFKVEDSFGNRLPDAGLVNGNVFGSYQHLICASQD
ncbi:MAG: cobyrinate a,c-diamide synthase [Rhodobacteraceae bacterium]|nr:cobyrinate a,c-diamide synthase [Paracoccaceae bacterium]